MHVHMHGGPRLILRLSLVDSSTFFFEEKSLSQNKNLLMQLVSVGILLRGALSPYSKSGRTGELPCPPGIM